MDRQRDPRDRLSGAVEDRQILNIEDRFAPDGTRALLRVVDAITHEGVGRAAVAGRERFAQRRTNGDPHPQADVRAP